MLYLCGAHFLEAISTTISVIYLRKMGRLLRNSLETNQSFSDCHSVFGSVSSISDTHLQNTNKATLWQINASLVSFGAYDINYFCHEGPIGAGSNPMNH